MDPYDSAFSSEETEESDELYRLKHENYNMWVPELRILHEKKTRLATEHLRKMKEIKERNEERTRKRIREEITLLLFEMEKAELELRRNREFDEFYEWALHRAEKKE